MKDDILLYWLTHLGSGSWSSFKRAADSLLPEGGSSNSYMRGLPVLLSELGFVTFFVDDSDEWRIRPPALIGLTSLPGNAALCGARTEKLVDDILSEADNLGCAAKVTTLPFGIRRIVVTGTDQELAAIAQTCDISYQPNYSLRLCQQLPSIFDLIESAPQKSAPQNWVVSSFNLTLDDPTWVDGFQSGSACKYSRGYGKARYLLHIETERANGKEKFLALDRQEVVYAAAALRCRELASYDAAACVMITHAQATLPTLYAQAACLGAFQPSSLQPGRRVYRQINPIVAHCLLILLGQNIPPFYELPAPLTSKRKKSS